MTKVISISDEAYSSLKQLKHGNESFSEIVIRVTSEEKRKKFMSTAGVWKGDKEIEKIFKEVAEERKKAKMRDVDL